VYAYSNTYTGSIGVVYGKLNVAGLYEKLGINVEIIKRGENAAIDTMARGLEPAERAKLREGVDQVYRSFLDRVSEGRDRPVSEIEPLAQGRVWMGVQAKSNGLVDELGGLDQVIARVKERAKIGAAEKIRVVLYPRKRSLLEELFDTSGEGYLGSAMRARVRDVEQRLGLDAGLLGVLAQGGFLRVAPFWIRVN
jgi:protease-4